MASDSKLHVIRKYWSCCDFVTHEHRWYWTALWCGRFQRTWRLVVELLVFVAAPFGDTAARFALWLNRKRR